MKALLVLVLLVLGAGPAFAKHHHGIHLPAGRHHHYAQRGHGVVGRVDGRPSAWCGWFGRFNFVSRDPGPAFNLAANWRKIGTPDPSPQVGDIVVWPHHVGKIVGSCVHMACAVWSGNDGHTVRTRVRSVVGAVFRRLSWTESLIIDFANSFTTIHFLAG